MLLSSHDFPLMVYCCPLFCLCGRDLGITVSHDLSPSAHIKRLKLPSLELRRLYNDLIWCYKILFGYVDVRGDEFFAPSPAVHTSGHPYKLFKKHSTIRSSKLFSVNVSLTRGIIYHTTLSVLTVSVLLL